MVIEHNDTNPESVGKWIHGTIIGATGTGRFTVILKNGDFRERIIAFGAVRSGGALSVDSTRSSYYMTYNSTTNATSLFFQVTPMLIVGNTFNPYYNEVTSILNYSIFIARNKNAFSSVPVESIEIDLRGII